MSIQEQVHILPNDELKNLLEQYGYKPGPVVGTTRRVYENKLIKFIQEAVSTGANSPLNSPSRKEILVFPSSNGIHDDHDDVEIINGFAPVVASPNKKRPAPTAAPTPSVPILRAATISPAKPIFPLTPEMSPEDEKMEGEESFRFVGAPTFDDDNSFLSGGATQIRQRGATGSNRLYPDLFSDSDNREKIGRFENESPIPGSSTHPPYRGGLTPRTAQPRNIYGDAASAASKANSMSVWVKVAIAILVTIFLVMLGRRILENEFIGRNDDDV